MFQKRFVASKTLSEFKTGNFHAAKCKKGKLHIVYKNKLHEISFQPSPSVEAFNGFIPLDQLKITYDRASGPGGQNVNKVSTKVDLRFKVKEASWISEKVKERLLEDVRNKT